MRGVQNLKLIPQISKDLNKFQVQRELRSDFLTEVTHERPLREGWMEGGGGAKGARGGGKPRREASENCWLKQLPKQVIISLMIYKT